MTIAEKVIELRAQIIAAGNEPVPDAYQGVTKDRVSEVLREIDRFTTDQRDAVFALLDDVNDSFYSLQYKHFPSGITNKFISMPTLVYNVVHEKTRRTNTGS